MDSSPASIVLTPARQPQGRLTASLPDGFATLDPRRPALGDGLYDGTGKLGSGTSVAQAAT